MGLLAILEFGFAIFWGLKFRSRFFRGFWFACIDASHAAALEKRAIRQNVPQALEGRYYGVQCTLGLGSGSSEGQCSTMGTALQ